MHSLVAHISRLDTSSLLCPYHQSNLPLPRWANDINTFMDHWPFGNQSSPGDLREQSIAHYLADQHQGLKDAQVVPIHLMK